MKRAPFFVDERHAWLNASHPTWSQTNIGSDGSNLTLVFLSMNRVGLSERLLRSLIKHVPQFAGRILAVDNGSDSDELDRLESFFAECCPFPYSIMKLGRNFGVAGGRNRGFAAVETDWILSLDNDIYLTGNPFPQLQHDLAILGCHFLSVPLINPDLKTFYSFGGHLNATLIEGAQPFLGTNCMLPANADLTRAAEVSPSGEGFLCSFLFGGASLLRRSTFEAAGFFEDAMLVGFEDIEFSLRLFRMGYKVGSSSIATFVHDHPPAATSSDRDYERARYSRQLLLKSAEHFERKHGFKVWSRGVDDWLAGREEDQSLSVSITPTQNNLPEMINRKPRIALVVDAANWAFANIARQLVKHLSHQYDFEIISTHTLDEIEWARLAERGQLQAWHLDNPKTFGKVLIRSQEFDIVHVFWRSLLTLLGDKHFYGPQLNEYISFLGLTCEEFRVRFVEPACFTTSVYDHLFQDGAEAEIMSPVLNSYVEAYTVSSERLGNIYEDHSIFRKPDAVITDGVDLDLFYPKNLERFESVEERDIVVGWVGNSRWCQEKDSKGVNTILIPAVEALQAEGLRVRTDFADRNGGFIPHRHMVDYYGRIDVLVCTSEIEGTPNPVLEALACGVPVVSTDVGVVPEALGSEQRAFILRERSVDALKEALRRLANSPPLFKTLSRENVHQAKRWSWQVKAAQFGAFFAEVLHRRSVEAGELLTKMCMLPFTTPSQEPDGGIRLCSASSIFQYRSETNMGNARLSGLEAVWRGEKYRHVRRTLLQGGDALTPYCSKCEYRHDGPAWLLQLHLALHAYHNGIRAPEVVQLLKARQTRYAEYLKKAPTVGLSSHHWPEDLSDALLPVRRLQVAPEMIVDGRDMPIYIDLNTLNRCNVSCVMCPPAIKYDRGEKRDKYYRLTVAEFERLIEGINLKSAHFVGAYAEPLLNKDIFDLVQRAHELGAFTAITSNAAPLVPPFARRLIEAGLDMMSISLHGATKKTAEKIMKGSNFERIISNIKSLQDLKLEYRTAKPDLYFNFVSQRDNIRELPDFVDLAAELGVKHVQVIHLIDGDEAVDRESNLVLYPNLLVPNVREALKRGKARGVNVLVSPAYAEALEQNSKVVCAEESVAA